MVADTSYQLTRVAAHSAAKAQRAGKDAAGGRLRRLGGGGGWGLRRPVLVYDGVRAHHDKTASSA
jgi:hypothetical protein